MVSGVGLTGGRSTQINSATLLCVWELLVNQLGPLTKQQLVGIYNLQQPSKQTEDALSQGMKALQQPMAETLANGSPSSSGSSKNVANYIVQMAMDIENLGTLEGFLRQVKVILHHERVQLIAVVAFDSSDKSKEKSGDQKAYVQQLESSRLKLNQLEQELQ
ncbi:TGACG-sequence-specific DNA-binding protein TGA-2.1-like [Quercus robur]|uniref:TGACG-sequence-specific DNA-binding protein TGA-2.1-like n=1 Tax=Quercus robur TaxID=38942 RepID=UPI0021611D58|nr:TGACG-sequence-specific DNA-binding protein TGA-2.1-like [Quercus robur]